MTSDRYNYFYDVFSSIPMRCDPEDRLTQESMIQRAAKIFERGDIKKKLDFFTDRSLSQINRRYKSPPGKWSTGFPDIQDNRIVSDVPIFEEVKYPLAGLLKMGSMLCKAGAFDQDLGPVPDPAVSVNDA